MDNERIATDVDPELQLLLHAIETLKIPEETVEQEEWLTFQQRWQDTLRADSSNIDDQLAILLAYLDFLKTKDLDTGHN
jgi:hypothetical protein